MFKWSRWKSIEDFVYETIRSAYDEATIDFLHNVIDWEQLTSAVMQDYESRALSDGSVAIRRR